MSPLPLWATLQPLKNATLTVYLVGNPAASDHYDAQDCDDYIRHYCVYLVSRIHNVIVVVILGVTGHLVDWSTRELVNLWTGQLADAVGSSTCCFNCMIRHCRHMIQRAESLA